MQINKEAQLEYLNEEINEEVSYDLFITAYRARDFWHKEWMTTQAAERRKLCVGISCVEDAIVRRHIHAAMKYSSNGFTGDYDFIPEDMLWVFNLTLAKDGYIYYIDPDGEKGEFDEYLELMK